MRPRIVVVGSRSAAKLEAVRAAVREAFGPEVEVTGVEVPSGVPEQPLGDEETLAGAEGRARAALAAVPAADLAVGLEGGVQILPHGAYNATWCVVLARDGRASRARGTLLPLPPDALPRLEAGEPLDRIIDGWAAAGQGKGLGGATGFLTRGLITRRDSLHHTVVHALAPFLRPELYGPARG